MPDFIRQLQSDKNIPRCSPFPSKGLHYVIFYAPTRKKYTYYELANNSRSLGLNVKVNTNTACYAAFKDMYTNYKKAYYRAPNYLVSKWKFYGYAFRTNDRDAPGPDIWQKASRTEGVLTYAHYRTYINESKRLGFLNPMDTGYWMERQEMTTHLPNYNMATLYFIWSHERYMVEYASILGYLYSLIKRYPDMDPYIRMTVALYVGGASTSHGYFPYMDCFHNVDTGDWSFKRNIHAKGMVKTAYKLRECCRKGVQPRQPLLKDCSSLGAFNCSNSVQQIKIDQYNMSDIPEKVDDLLTFKLEEYKDE